MRVRVTIEVGRVTIALRGPWRVKSSREVTSWWTQFGPLVFNLGGLKFSRKAARRVYDTLNRGAVGNLARLYKPN